MKLIEKIAGLMGYSRMGKRELWWPISTFDTGVGVKVTPEYALRVATVMACVRILAETIASLPLHVYRSLPNGGKEKDRSHHLYNLLHDMPNRWQTSFEFREMMQGHLCLRGNAYARILYNRRDIPVELTPIHPDRITIARLASGELQYIDRDPATSEERKYLQSDMLHLRGLSSDGVKGISPIEHAAVTIGLAIAGEQLGASFFRDGAVLSGVLEHPETLGDKAKTHLEESLKQTHGGASRAYKVMVLEEGMKWNQIGIKPEEGQFIESRKLSATDICAIFRVPPHLVANLDKATFSNIEHQSIDFVTHTVRPWIVRWEQALQRDVFAEEELGQYFAGFLMEGLLRGDTAARSRALSIQFQNGVINQDEWREIENRNPLPDGSGKKFYVPLNLIETGENQNANILKAWIDNAAERIASAEIRAVERRINGGPYATGFDEWLGQFYARHTAYVREAIEPIFGSAALNHNVDNAVAEITGESIKSFDGDGDMVLAKLTGSRLNDILTILNKHIRLKGTKNAISK